MAGRRHSLTALAGAGFAAAGCLLNLAWGTAAGAKTSFTGYFPASVYWGSSEYDPLNNPKGTGIYYIDTDKNSKSTQETDQKTAITFYADREGTQVIDKQTESVSGPSDIALIDLTFNNTSGSDRGAAAIYKITFKWNFDPFNAKCNAGMATSDPSSSNADCSWSFEEIAKLNGSDDFTEDGSVIDLKAYTAPNTIYLASGSSVTFRSAINYSKPSPRPPDSQKVPAPLPALGAGAAFGMSRRLRSRLRRGETLNSATVLAAPIPVPIAGRKHRELVASLYGDLLGGPRPM
jgi:hypothetical protein